MLPSRPHVRRVVALTAISAEQATAAYYASAFAFEILTYLHDNAKTTLKPFEHSTDMPQADEIFPISPSGTETVDTPLQDFIRSCQAHYGSLRKACIPFNEGRNIYADQCQHVVDQFKELVDFLQQRYSTVATSDLVLKMKLDNALICIRDLQPKLRDLQRQLHSSSRHQTQYANLQKDIRGKMFQLLATLEHLAEEKQ